MPETWLITGTSSGFGREMTEKLLARGDRVAATLRKPNASDDLTGALRRPPLGGGAGRDRCGSGALGGRSGLRRHGSSRCVMSNEGGQITYPNFSLYHMTKWAIEGFVEAVAQEVAPFGIELTIVEPGPARTGIGGGLVSPPPMPVYETTLAGDVRRALAAGAFAVKGDPVKMAQAMIDSVDRSPAPKRLALGSDTDTGIRAAVVDRLAALDAQKGLALSTDMDD